MRISEFIRKLKTFFNPQSALCTPHLFKHFSLSQQWVLLGLALLILGLLYFRFYYHPPPAPEAIVREFVVEVSGEIRNPGVYFFQNRPTLREAIERAGGLKETAQMEIPPTSEGFETGTLLTISRESSEVSGIRIKIGRMAANKLLVFSIPLDLNQVSTEDLCLVPGIGASLAQEIVAYRERRKAFRSVEELKKVKGIGEKKYQSLKPYFHLLNSMGCEQASPPAL